MACGRCGDVRARVYAEVSSQECHHRQRERGCFRVGRDDALDDAEDAVIEAGLERLSLAGDVRWWLFIHIEGERARPQRPRRGVVDRGFRFARGGCVASDESARSALEIARDEAREEWARWQHQPSHALGPRGELIPLDEVIPELVA
jgi:hypothetical protein